MRYDLLHEMYTATSEYNILVFTCVVVLEDFNTMNETETA